MPEYMVKWRVEMFGESWVEADSEADAAYEFSQFPVGELAMDSDDIDKIVISIREESGSS